MAKTSSIQKEIHREKLVARTQEKRKLLKAQALAGDDDARTALDKLPKNSSPQRLRNRCQLSGRARGFLRKFKMSRIWFRELALMGMIPGVVKASW